MALTGKTIGQLTKYTSSLTGNELFPLEHNGATYHISQSQFSASYAVTASHAVTASYVLNAVSSSFATTASYASNSGTNIYTADGTLASARTVTMGGNSLLFNGGTVKFGTSLPPTWDSLVDRAQIGNGAIYGYQDETGILANAYYNGGWKYIANNFAGFYNLKSGQHIWYTAASGTANGTIAFANRMVLTQAGRLLLGTTTESTYLLDVNGTARVSGNTTFGAAGNNGLIVRTFASANPQINYTYNEGISIGQSITFGFSTTTFSSYDNSGATINATLGIASSTSLALTSYAFGLTRGATTDFDPNFIFGIQGSGNIICKNDATIRPETFAYAVGGNLNIQGGQPRGDVPNASGGNLLINGGLGQGTGTPGDVIISTAATTGSGTTLQTFTQRWFVKGNTGILSNVSSPNASAIIQIDSTTKGFLPPRMTTTQKNAIGTPAQGLMVFDTTLVKLCVYSGTAWETISST